MPNSFANKARATLNYGKYGVGGPDTDKLGAYLHDGSLEIDNNLVENAIRPLALGRKNYLFAGSHDAARRAASIYSFFAMCRKEEVNPFEWLKNVFENILETKVTQLHTLYPKHYKQLRKM